MTTWVEIREELRKNGPLSVKQLSMRVKRPRSRVSEVLNSRRRRGKVVREEKQVGKRRIYFYNLSE